MPNGGPDCCGNCLHNHAVQKIAHKQPENPDLFWIYSYCTLRKVKIRNPFWTYCPNFCCDKHTEKSKKDIPVGFILTNGLYEGYVRIPWDDMNEPEISVSVICSICGRKVNEGIMILHDNKSFGFCTNRHYVQWWKTLHQDDSFKVEDFESPEGRYKKK